MGTIKVISPLIPNYSANFIRKVVSKVVKEN